MSINVAAVDDQDIILMGIQQSLSLSPQFTFLGGFSTLEQLYKSSACRSVNVVLLDDSLPNIPAPQAIQSILKYYPEAAILLLGSQLTARDIHEALRFGAAGIVCKKEPLQDVLGMAIQHAHNGKVYLSPAAGLIALSVGAVPTLTKRLYDTLLLIAKYEESWMIQHQLGISRKAVYLRTSRLFEIFGVNTTRQLIAKATEMGLIPKDE